MMSWAFFVWEQDVVCDTRTMKVFFISFETNRVTFLRVLFQISVCAPCIIFNFRVLALCLSLKCRLRVIFL